MKAFFRPVSRCLLATVWLLGALQLSGKSRETTRNRMESPTEIVKLLTMINCSFNSVLDKRQIVVSLFSDWISESKIVCQAEPEDPTIVVLGVNSDTVSLKWESCDGDAGETLNSFVFKRQKPDDVTPQPIASRGNNDGGFTMSDPFKDFKKYRAFQEQKLQIFNVQRNEKYVYTLSINFQKSDGVFEDKIFQVAVVVKGKLEKRVFLRFNFVFFCLNQT